MKSYKLILLFTLLVFSSCYVTQQEPIINPNEQSKVLEKSFEEYKSTQERIKEETKLKIEEEVRLKEEERLRKISEARARW